MYETSQCKIETVSVYLMLRVNKGVYLQGFTVCVRFGNLGDLYLRHVLNVPDIACQCLN